MKKHMFFLFLHSLAWSQAVDFQDIGSYIEERKIIVRKDKSLRFDSKMTLSSKEKKVSLYLEKMKNELLAQYREQEFFPPARNFLLEKKVIEKSALYRFLEKMPKGGLLHIHSGSVLQAKWLIDELTTMDGCYVYWLDEGLYLKGTLHFYEEGAAPNGFFSVKELRGLLSNFDEMLLSLLEVGEKNLKDFNLWKAFEECFTRTKGLIYYKPAFMKYYKASMESFIEDNIQYMELRALNTPIYNLDGSQENEIAVVEAFLQVKNEIKEQNPDFDFKIIHTEFRHVSQDTLLNQIEKAYFLRSLFPDFVIGYDLVGEEDTEKTAFDHVNTLIQAKSFEKQYGVNMPFYFHAGESVWPHSKNLFDAVLLKSKRIGHGLNLFKYPHLMSKIKEEGICLEVCPISNQVLGYVADLRLHPAIGYLKHGVPCVLASDDPGVFGYHGMSFDVWEAVMAWDLDLKALKQLFLNSLVYSGMTEESKKKAIKTWEIKWDRFLDEVCKNEVIW